MPRSDEALRLEQQLRKQIDQIVDAQTRDLVDAWVTAWDEVAPDLRDTLAVLAADAADGHLRRGVLLRSKRLTKALDAVRRRLEELTAVAGVRINQDIRKVIDQAGAAQAEIIAAMLPDGAIDLESWSRVDERVIDAMVRRITQQITASHRPISTKAYRAVRRELVRGIAVGSNPRATAARMVKRAERKFNGGLTRALTIARTETLDAHRAGAETGQAQHADVLVGWIWLATLTPRTCRACLSMHGRLFPLDEPGPKGHQQCRCARSPKSRSWRELGFNIDEPEDITPDADAFFEGLTPEQQLDLLGPKGFSAWMAGDFPREKWAKKRETDGWRDSYVAADPGDRHAGGYGQQPPSTPPVAPSLAPGDDRNVPGFGPLLGKPEQQRYQPHGRPFQLPRDAAGGLVRPDEANANFWWTYIADPDARAAAILQYFYEPGHLVKEIAHEIRHGTDRTPMSDMLLDSFHERMLFTPATGATATNYSREDLVADLEGAARWLLAQQPGPVGTLWRGINVQGVDLLDADLVARVKAVVDTSGWWFKSATTDEGLALRYANGPGVNVLLVIDDASGIRLHSVGRMAETTEVLMSGRLRDVSYTLAGTTIIIHGRWAR